MVRRGRHAYAGARHGDPPPRARLPRLLDGRERAARPGASELPAARAARARGRGPARGRLGRAPGRPPVDRAARTRERSARRRRPRARRADRLHPARGDRLRPRRRADRRAGRAARRRDGLAPAGRADLRRALRRARPLARRRPLRRAAARRGVRLRAPARARPARRRHAHLEAPAHLARGPSAGADRPARGLARANAAGGADPRLGSGADPGRARVGNRDAERATRSRLARVVALRRRARAGRARRVARRLRAQADRRTRGGAARRGAGLGQLLDADPRRRGLLPAIGQAPARALEPRRQRDRRRRLVGSWERRSQRASPPGS